jgi:hypothetical protein
MGEAASEGWLGGNCQSISTSRNSASLSQGFGLVDRLCIGTLAVWDWRVGNTLSLRQGQAISVLGLWEWILKQWRTLARPGLGQGFLRVSEFSFWDMSWVALAKPDGEIITKLGHGFLRVSEFSFWDISWVAFAKPSGVYFTFVGKIVSQYSAGFWSNSLKFCSLFERTIWNYRLTASKSRLLLGSDELDFSLR